MDATNQGFAEATAARPAAPPRLPKHRYPLPIVAAAVLVLAGALYSFTQAPGLVSTSRELDAGRAALHRGDYATAVAKLQAAYAADPSSHVVRLAYAEAAFADNQPRTALTVLAGIKLSGSDYDALQKYMPVRYDQYFHEEP